MRQHGTYESYFSCFKVLSESDVSRRPLAACLRAFLFRSPYHPLNHRRRCCRVVVAASACSAWFAMPSDMASVAAGSDDSGTSSTNITTRSTTVCDSAPLDTLTNAEAAAGEAIDPPLFAAVARLPDSSPSSRALLPDDTPPAAHPPATDSHIHTQHFKEYIKSDPHLLLHKLIYLIYCASLVFYLPFVGVYLRDVGLNKEEIGIVLSAMPFAILVGSPVWGMIADQSEAHRRAVMLGCLVVSTLMRCFLWVATDFWWLFFYVLVCEIIGSPVMVILDASTFAILDATSSTTKYGNSRAWGAAGWGAAAPLEGYLLDTYGFSALFIAVGVATLPCLYLVWLLPVETREASKDSVVDGYRRLISVDSVLFLTVVFIMGVIGAGVIAEMLPQFLLDIGADNTLLGVALLFTCISETPFFFVSSPILDRVGHLPVLCASLLTSALRVWYYSTLTDPWWTLPAELLHGEGDGWGGGVGWGVGWGGGVCGEMLTS